MKLFPSGQLTLIKENEVEFLLFIIKDNWINQRIEYDNVKVIAINTTHLPRQYTFYDIKQAKLFTIRLINNN